MHELGITENIISIVTEHAEEKGANKVTKIHLKIGEMTQIVDDCISFYFEQLSEGTIAEGAELIFDKIPIRVRCSKCGMEKEASDYDFICPSCKTVCIEFINGRELAVDNIEIE
jgi:hydrogenase nickel incorporation protein HypA/HybF